MRYQSEFAKEIEKYAKDWQYKEPLGTPFTIDLWEYIANKLKENYVLERKK